MIDAVEAGFGIEYNAKNAEFALKLRESGLWFAARKSYSEAAELAALLDSGNGTKRPWSEFLELAKPIVGNYNKQWLKTEYNTAVRSARIASLWQDILLTRETYPNIEYIRTRAANPREAHLKYVGIIRPIEDLFWDTHTPPLDYGCLCSIRKTRKKATAIPENLPVPRRGLENNPGKSGELFTDGHPYARRARGIERTLEAEFRQLVRKMGRFYQMQTPGKGTILVHPGAEKNGLMENIRAAVRLIDELGLKVKIRPTMLNEGKQPDFLIGEKLADLKTLKNATNLKNAIQGQIKNAGKQSAHTAVLDFAGFRPGNLTVQDALRSALQTSSSGKMYNNSVKEVIILHSGKPIRISRKEVEDWSFQSKLTPLKLP